jgi:hypothetical protein
MANYTIILNDAQDKALNAVATSAQDWINNAVYERCRLAIEEIVNAEVQRKLAANETISGSKEDIVLAAPIKSAAQREAEAESLFESSAEQAAKLNP